MVCDAASSRSQTDRHFALERMRGIGAFLNTTESVILSLLGDAKHPSFKEVQAIIKSLEQSTGLVREEATEEKLMQTKSSL